jgi:hypothetical protein
MEKDRYAQLLKAGTVLLVIDLALTFAVVVGLDTEFLPVEMSSFVAVAFMSAALLAVLAVFVARVKPWTLALPAMGVALVLSAFASPVDSTWVDIILGEFHAGDGYFGLTTPVAVVALAYVPVVAWTSFRRPATSTQAISWRKLKATATTLAAVTITATAEFTALILIFVYKVTPTYF